MPAGRADAFPVELVLVESGGVVVEAPVVLGVFSADDAAVGVGFFSLMMLLLTSQHCLDVTPWSEFDVTPVPCAFTILVAASSMAPQTEMRWIVLMLLSSTQMSAQT
jgi:hypothetical protein